MPSILNIIREELPDNCDYLSSEDKYPMYDISWNRLHN
jgi:hypothetical protein